MAAARAPRGDLASSWPPVGRSSWAGSARADLTIGQPGRWKLRRARRAMLAAILEAGGGYTVTAAAGGWRGGRERSAVISVIGAELSELAPVLEAAARAGWAAGLEAIQLELFTPAGYASSEWRQI